MKFTIAAIALVAGASAQSAIPTPGQSCTGNSAFCASNTDTNIILRCDGGKIQPGNCNDNTGEPTQGALCNSFAPNTATCSIIGSGSSSTSAAPSPGATCTGSSAYCAGGPIILRCEGGKLQPGNCNDNLNEPPQGATCVAFATNTATCSAFGTGSSTSATSSGAAPTTYACNPAHSYPGGSSCISTAGSLTLVGPTTTTAAVSATSTGGSVVSQISDGQPQSPSATTVVTGAASTVGVGAGLLCAIMAVVYVL